MKTDYINACINRRMLVAIVLSVFILYIELFYAEGYGSIKSCSHILVTIGNVFALSEYILFTGMFPGMPYGLSLLEERNSGYLLFVLYRKGKKRYLIEKVNAACFAGILTVIIPYAILIGTVAYISNDFGEKIDGSLSISGLWMRVYNTCGTTGVLAGKGVLLALFAILWTEVTLIVSLFVRNKYLAFAVPFILYQIIWLIIPINQINPVFLIRADFDDMPVCFPFVLLIFYIIIAGLIFLKSAMIMLKKDSV